MLNLGDRVRDKITGYTGIIMARTEWLYGCNRYIVQAEALHDGKPVEHQAFDEPQLEVVIPEAHTDTAKKPGGGDRDYIPTRH